MPEQCLQTQKMQRSGLKNLHQQNRCSLWNLLSNLYFLPLPPWLHWISLQHPRRFCGTKKNKTFLCKTINNHIPDLQNISFVMTNNSSNPCFWYDTWLLPKPIATDFPSLFSHFVVPLIRVANIWRLGLESNMRNRLTYAAMRELSLLMFVL